MRKLDIRILHTSEYGISQTRCQYSQLSKELAQFSTRGTDRSLSRGNQHSSVRNGVQSARADSELKYVEGAGTDEGNLCLELQILRRASSCVSFGIGLCTRSPQIKEHGCQRESEANPNVFIADNRSG